MNDSLQHDPGHIITLSTNRSDGSESAASLEAVMVDSVNSSNGIFSRN